MGSSETKVSNPSPAARPQPVLAAPAQAVAHKGLYIIWVDPNAFSCENDCIVEVMAESTVSHIGRLLRCTTAAEGFAELKRDFANTDLVMCSGSVARELLPKIKVAKADKAMETKFKFVIYTYHPEAFAVLKEENPIVTGVFREPIDIINIMDQTYRDKEIRTIAGEMREEFVCPISQEIMRDPVIAADGVTYERRQIENWMSRSDVSPVRNVPLGSRALIPNCALRRLIEMWDKARNDRQL